MTDYKPGDRITLEHPDGSKLVREVSRLYANPAVGTVPATHYELISDLEESGWSVTSHIPAVSLPTEPGIYEDVCGVLWEFVPDGENSEPGMNWWEVTAGRYRTPEALPLVRLRPVVETAAEVIDWFAAQLEVDTSPEFDITRAREHFGVVSLNREDGNR